MNHSWLRICPVAAFSDNYIWVLHDGRDALAVDPGCAEPLKEFLRANDLTLRAVLVTHHHRDHVGGLDDLLGECAIPVYGPAAEAIPGRSVAVSGPMRIELAAPAVTLDVLDVPGHTAGHVAYVAAGRCGGRWLFCGDTLFSAGCGRLFEGTAAQMSQSLVAIAALPGDTCVCCAHEYTLANLRFAIQVEPGNSALVNWMHEAQALRAAGRPTLPTTVAHERATNPFLRCREPEVVRAAVNHVRAAAGAGSEGGADACPDEADVFAMLRRWKDEFRG